MSFKVSKYTHCDGRACLHGETTSTNSILNLWLTNDAEECTECTGQET